MRISAKGVGVRRVVAALAVAAVVIAGCGGGSTPQPRAAAPATTTATDTAATTTATPATTTTTDTAAADTGAGSASLEPLPAEADVGDIGAGTLWPEVFDTFTASEQSCVREAMSDAMLETLLGARVLPEDSDDVELPVAAMFACLRPETSDAIWTSIVITGMAQEENLELGSAERSCMREQLAGLLSGEDLAALITQDDSEMSDDELAMALRTTAVLFECVPDYFIQTILSEAGIDPESLSEDEISCLRELATDLDDLNWLEISAASVSDEIYGLLFETMAAVLECLPEPLASSLWGFDTDNDEVLDVADDHADRLEDATPIAVGDAVAAAMDYTGDVDWFSFEAHQGDAYQIDVAPSGYWDSTVTLHDGQGSVLEFNDDHGGSLASRIVWTAPASASYRVAVDAWGGYTGTYTLTVTRRSQTGPEPEPESGRPSALDPPLGGGSVIAVEAGAVGDRVGEPWQRLVGGDVQPQAGLG